MPAAAMELQSVSVTPNLPVGKPRPSTVKDSRPPGQLQRPMTRVRYFSPVLS